MRGNTQVNQEYGATFIINDHVDLALAVEADGVHIGQEDLPIEVVRSLAGDELLIGVSTHSPEEAEDAVRRALITLLSGPSSALLQRKMPVNLSAWNTWNM